jgi:hypothetical protein
MAISGVGMRREFVEPPDLKNVSRRLSGHWTSEPIEFVRNFQNLVYRMAENRIVWLAPQERLC